jgi:hypothetical protein
MRSAVSWQGRAMMPTSDDDHDVDQVMAAVDVIHADHALISASNFPISRRSSVVSSVVSTSRRGSVASVPLMSASRLPLAPLGPQVTPAFAVATVSKSSDSRSSLNDEAVFPPSSSSWVHRLARPITSSTVNVRTFADTDVFFFSGSQTRLISTPARLQSGYRRTSLPALFAPQPSLMIQQSSSSSSNVQNVPDNRLYEQLRSYVLTSPRKSSVSSRKDDPALRSAAVDISPLAPSPRTSLVIRRPNSITRSRSSGKNSQHAQEESSDSDEEARHMDRAKLRAIDDGGRRPSLPINIPVSSTPTSTSMRASMQLDSDMNAPPLGAPSSAKPLPDIPVPSSDPGPVGGLNGFSGFDLEFIFGAREFPNGPLLPRDNNPKRKDSLASVVAEPARRMSISLDSGRDAAAATHEWEDTFARFVNQNDREYAERRGQWSFQKQQAPKISTAAALDAASASDAKLGAIPKGNAEAENLALMASGLWECGALGKYWVGTLDEFARISQPLLHPPPTSSSSTVSRKQALVVRKFASLDAGTTDPNPRGFASAQPPGTSTQRIHIHKHSRAPAFSLFLGPTVSSASSGSSILLATKKVHLHLSAKKQSNTASGGATESGLTSQKASSIAGNALSSPERTQSSSLLSPGSPSTSPTSSPIVSSITSTSIPRPTSHQHLHHSSFSTTNFNPTSTNVDDIKLPRHAPPPGYIPPFVNKDILEQEQRDPMDVDARNTHPGTSRPTSRVMSPTYSSEGSTDHDHEQDMRTVGYSYASPSASSRGHGVGRPLSRMSFSNRSSSGMLQSQYASDFATISPEVREVLLAQLRLRHHQQSSSGLGGRLKRALAPSSSSSAPPSPVPTSAGSTFVTSHHSGGSSFATNASSAHAQAHLGMLGSTSSSHHGLGYIGSSATRSTGMATYQPPWMLMAPGFLKEEREHVSRKLKNSFESAGMFISSDDRDRYVRNRSRPSRQTSDEDIEMEDGEGDEIGVGKASKGATSSRGSTSTIKDRRASRRDSLGVGEGTSSPTRSFASRQTIVKSRSKSVSLSRQPSGLFTTSGGEDDVHTSLSYKTKVKGKSKEKGKERVRETGKEKVGEDPQSSSLNTKPSTLTLQHRNNVLEHVGIDTMCMAVPLWNFRDDLELKRLHGSPSNPSAGSSGGITTSSDAPVVTPDPERKWLLLTFIAFEKETPNSFTNRRRDTITPTSSGSLTLVPPSPLVTPIPKPAASFAPTHSPLSSLFFHVPSRVAKKRPRRPLTTHIIGPPVPVDASNPRLRAAFGGWDALRMGGGVIPTPPPTVNPTDTTPHKAFRVVGRVISDEQLRYSGLRYPGADLTYDDKESSYRGHGRGQGSATNSFSDGEERPFDTVLAVCQDGPRGLVEFVPEGLDALGFCGEGRAPGVVTGAIAPWTFERECGPLTKIGKEVVELCWAGCLALLD